MTINLTRRSLLVGGGAAGMAGTMPAAFAAPASGLEILGAMNGSTIILVDLLDSGKLAAVAPGATFRTWHDTDELRAGIVSGKTKLFTTPSHVPANLVNRGLPLKMLCILGMGHLSIVTSDESIKDFKDLAGKPVLAFFRHDMPDLIFRACARMEGLDPDKEMQLTYVQSHMEAGQMLVAGKATTALLAEPMATAAIMMAAQQGKTLHRAFDLSQIWGRHKGSARIPMAGIALHASLIDESPELIAALRTGLPLAKAHVLADPAAAGKLAERTMEMRAHMFEMALPRFHMDLISARAAKAELVAFYETLIDLEPDVLAGKLPPDDFYMDL